MHKEIIEKAKKEFDKALEFVTREIAKIRTGQANPSLVEDVKVNIFGELMALKQLGSITCPERRQILIQPWDISYIEPIEKALQQSSLGTSPVVDGAAIRVHLPMLTQEYRQQLSKLLGEKAEDARQTMRKSRDEAWEEIQAKTRTGEIREDDKFKGKEDLQKLIDEYSKRIEELVERKKQELEVE
jgi:ribosome recycling factor